jgi:guanylate kinase
MIIISGPSGVGKSYIQKQLCLRNPLFKSVLPSTTRLPRVGEINGIDYEFISITEFLKIDRNSLINYFELNGNFYFTRKKYVYSIIDCGLVPIYVSKTEQIKNLVQFFPNAKVIYLYPTDFEFLRSNMLHRGDNCTN